MYNYKSIIIKRYDNLVKFYIILFYINRLNLFYYCCELKVGGRLNLQEKYWKVILSQIFEIEDYM